MDYSTRSKVTVKHADYKLSDDKLIKKKLESCDRVPLTMELKGDNVVIKSSTLTFEMIKPVLLDYYQDKTYICCEKNRKDT